MAFKELITGVSESISTFTHGLSHFRELSGLRENWDKNTFPSSTETSRPKEIVMLRAYTDYLSLVRRFTELKPDEVLLLDKVNTDKNKIRLSAGKIEKPGAAELHKALGHDVVLLNSIIAESADKDSQTFIDAQSELVDMMGNAQKVREAIIIKLKSGGNVDPQQDEIMRELGTTFVDGNETIYKVPDDPKEYKVDKAIWGYMQISQPEAQLHFLMAHFFERFVTQKLKGKVELSEHKDYLLNAFTDVLLLDAAHGNMSRNEKRLYDVWIKPRKDGNGSLIGGLGWIDQNYLKLYQ